MCYGTRVVKEAKELELRYKVNRLYGEMNPDEELTYNFANGFSHPNMWIIPQEKSSNMIPIKWGLIPHYRLGVDSKEYYKETVRYGSGLNAKSEKLFTSNNYKRSALKRRCIIPVDGFYEPHTTKRNGKVFKVPFYFYRKDLNPINLAGIYAVTKDKIVTFSILTKAATPLFSLVHNTKERRPVAIKDSDVANWLNSSLNETDVKNFITEDMSDEYFQTHPISRDLYSKDKGDRDTIIQVVDYPEVKIKY